MITGEFTEDNQIVVKLTLFDATEQPVEIEAIPDTGFSDHLIIPFAAVRRLGLVEVDTVQAAMADGRIVGFSVCEAVLEWDGNERAIPVFAGGSKALLGMALLRGSLGTFEFFPGGLCTVEPGE